MCCVRECVLKCEIETIIMCYVQEGANPLTSRQVLLSEHYAACHNLVLYYQMVGWCLFLLYVIFVFVLNLSEVSSKELRWLDLLPGWKTILPGTNWMLK